MKDLLASWHPELVLRGAWAEQAGRRLWSDPYGAQVCVPAARSWLDAESGAHLAMEWWWCEDEEEAAALVRRAADRSGDSDGRRFDASVLGDRKDVFTDTSSDQSLAHVRMWGQGNIAASLGVECGDHSADECADLSGAVLRDLSGRLPGAVHSSDLLRIFLWEGLGQGLLLLFGHQLLMRVGKRIQFFYMHKADSDHRNWNDVSMDASILNSATRRAYVGRGLRLLAVVAIVVGALGLAGVVSLKAHHSVAIMLLGFVSYRVVMRRLRVLSLPEQEADWRYRNYQLGRITWKRLLGQTVVIGSFLVFVALVAAWFLGAWVDAGGGVASSRFTTLKELVLGTGMPPRVAFSWLLLTSFVAYADVHVRVTLLVLGVTACFLVLRSGRHLLARPMVEQIQLDDRPHLLLLRNFEDDRIKVPSSRLVRRGFLSATVHLLSYSDKQYFEELLARQLNEIGPVVAVTEPGSRLRRLGAAKINLPHHGWRDRVEELANSAKAVVISAAPVDITDGLRWEIEMIATKLRHRRIIVVVPPRRPRKRLVECWQRFRREVGQYPLFQPMTEDWIPDGVQFLVKDPSGDGWHAWGSTSRTEWTYAVAMRRVAAFVETSWAASENTRGLAAGGARASSDAGKVSRLPESNGDLGVLP